MKARVRRPVAMLIEEGAPWQLFFWISWPLTLALGVWAGYIMRPPSSEKLNSMCEDQKLQLVARQKELSETKTKFEAASKESQKLAASLKDMQEKFDTQAFELAETKKALDKARGATKAAEPPKAPEPKSEGTTPPAKPEEKKPAAEQPKAAAPTADPVLKDLFAEDQGAAGSGEVGDLAMQPMASSKKMVAVGDWKGLTNKTSSTFNIPTGRWEIEYIREKGPGRELTVKVMRPDTITPVETVTAKNDDYKGKLQLKDPGDFQLEIECKNCQWNVKVTRYE